MFNRGRCTSPQLIRKFRVDSSSLHRLRSGFTTNMNGTGPPPVPGKSAIKNWNLGIGPVLSHAFNADRSRMFLNIYLVLHFLNLVLAVSSAEKVFIFEFKNGKWEKKTELPQHDLAVTGLDWAPKTNRLVSSSHDKNSFVWTPQPDGAYKPELVLLRSQFGLTSVAWSPLGLF